MGRKEAQIRSTAEAVSGSVNVSGRGQSRSLIGYFLRQLPGPVSLQLTRLATPPISELVMSV
jgi:hypothetical protein